MPRQQQTTTAIPWACARCLRSTGRATNSALCRDCRARLVAEGRFWCPGCAQARPLRQRGPVGYCRLCHAAYVASYRRGPGRETQAAYLAQRKARRHADPTYHPHRPSTPGRPCRRCGRVALHDGSAAACRDCAGALAAQGRRYCPKCGQDRPRADFYAVRPSHCRACRLAASRAHYQRGRDAE